MTDLNNKKEQEALYRYSRQQPKESVIVEIGSFKGLSTNIIADAIKYANGGKVYAVDLWEGHTGWKKDFKDTFKIYKLNTRHNKHIIVSIRGNDKKVYKKFKDNSIDMIFFDGDHSYQGTSDSIKVWLPKCKPGATLLFHDSLDRPVYRAIVDNMFKFNILWFNQVESLGVCKLTEGPKGMTFWTFVKHLFYNMKRI